MMRTLLPGILLALAATGGAAEEFTPLTAITYDSVTLRNGENLKGAIVERLSNGALRFQQVGRPANVIDRADIIAIEERQTLAQAVGRRARQALAAGDQADLLRTIKFALQAQDPPARDPARKERPDDIAPSTGAEVRGAAATVVLLALDRKATPELATAAIPLFTALGQTDNIVLAAERGLAADPNWTAGYETQANIFLAAKDEGRMKVLVARWLDRQPTAFTANRYRAAMAESLGDLRTAVDSWRKGWDLHQDPESAVGFIRTSLARGDAAEALRVAKALKASGKGTAEADAWLGAALMANEACAEAQPLLEASSAAGLSAATLDMVRWNLGVIATRAGDDTAAKRWFHGTKHEAIATAWLERRPLPEQRPAGLERTAKDMAMVLNLEERRFAPTLQALRGDDRPRAVFLAQVADILRSQGQATAINALAATKSQESLRWQAYGQLLAGHDREAEQLLASLPDTDGWALCCRAWLAISRKDDTSARLYIERLSNAKDIPQAYAERLRREFSSAQDEVVVEGFDGDRPYPESWTADLGGGPGMVIAQQAGHLVITGPLADGTLASVWRDWPSQRLHKVETNLAAAVGCAAGVLLLDGTRKNGVFVASTLRGPAWRVVTAGTWGPWTPLTKGAGTTLALSLERGRILASVGNGPGQEIPAPLGAGPTLAAGLALVPDGPGPVKAAFDHLRIQLTPLKPAAK